jgi:sterol desaturase/sphingolipid hydroxylase (fatty acid hydroxylase superfamily)
MDAVKTHSGWVWPGVDQILRYVPYYEGAIFHDYHHRSFIWNYASRFSFIDVWFGTYKLPYDPLDHLNDEVHMDKSGKVVVESKKKTVEKKTRRRAASKSPVRRTSSRSPRRRAAKK